ncbi:sensor histidine kinase [Flammeovirga pectinis]|uniref:histidine kinase n=1 Tax=Flammeovirga pectinis TaxID=2494373 RepID=A0A3Q9FMZ4_9BACT|nr:sensor histidine kinase [Flammeovirga pectinis]AZQ60801.1 sensor histidine kinase [Flammeovirga pectinis]
MIKIRTSFTLLFSTVILFLLIILVIFLRLLDNRKEFGSMQFQRQSSFALSDYLIDRNNELTRLCTNTIYSKNEIWKEAYQKFLNYDDPSAQFLKSDFRVDSLQAKGFTSQEIQLINNALLLSNKAIQIEKKALALPTQSTALALLQQKEYLDAKNNANALLLSLEKRIDSRTTKTWNESKEEGFTLFYTLLLLLLFVLLFSTASYYLIRLRLKRQERIDKKFKESVVELQSTKDNLVESDHRFTLATQGTGILIWQYDLISKQLNWFPKNSKLLDFPSEKLTPSIASIQEQIHKGDLDLFNQQFKNCIENGSAISIDVRCYTATKELKWYNFRSASIKKNTHIVGTFSDINEQMKQEEKVINAILETEDKERSRIARDIHDSLQQTMSTSLLNLEKVRVSDEISDKELMNKFTVGYNYLKKAIQESRTLAHNLMPKVIHQNGISPAIQALISALEGSTATQIIFYDNLNEERLKLSVEMTLYRIVQESINNVIKYSEAEKCTIQLLKYSDLLVLTIEDNGVGFDLSTTKNTFGLNSLKTRAEAIGAYLQISSVKNKGTEIVLELAL